MAAQKKPTITVSNKKGKSAKGKAKAKAKEKEFFGLMDMPDELAERGREIWLAGLGALSMVEEEGVKLFNALVEKGEAWEKEGRKQIDAAKGKIDAARDKVESAVGDAAAQSRKITEIDDMIVSTVEDAVEKILQRLGVPTHAEVKDLAGKVEKLSNEVVGLAKVMEHGRNGKATAKQAKATTTTTAKKVVYHVVPKDDGWALKQESVAEPLSLHATKNEALEAGRERAKTHMPSRLVAHKKDGKVQESTTYEA